VLAVNGGSSSVKFALFNLDSSEQVLRGVVTASTDLADSVDTAIITLEAAVATHHGYTS